MTLYELLADSLPPCAGAAASNRLRSRPGVGSGLARIVARCLEPDPSARYPDAAAAADALRRATSTTCPPERSTAHGPVLPRWVAAWRTRR